MKKFIQIVGIMLGCVSILYYFICGITIGFGISILWIWLVFGLFMIISNMFRIHLIKRKLPNTMNYIVRCIFVGVVLVFLVFESNVIFTMNKTAKQNLDYIIVLGARVKGQTPSKALQGRIDTAFTYLIKNPSTKVIASGGQGTDETMSEGECIAQTLREKGILPDRILVEGNSTTTVQNIKNSFRLIPKTNKTIGIVTSNFHVFRALKIASGTVGIHGYGISSSYSGILLPHYMVREFITYVLDVVSGNIDLF